MKLRTPEGEPPAATHFIRRVGNDSERGPFTIENLRDLAEFGNLMPEDEVRFDNQAYRRLVDCAELMTAIFPENSRAYRFKTYEKTEDKEAPFAPVDASSIVRCDNTTPGAGEFPIEVEGRQEINAMSGSRRSEARSPKPAVPPDPEKIDVKEILRESAECARARGSPANNATQPKAIPLFPGFSFFLRWGLAAFLVSVSVRMLLTATPDPVDRIFSLLIAMVLCAIGTALVCRDVIDWTLNWLERVITSSPPPPANWDAAQDLLDAGQEKQALHAVERSLKHHPHDLRGYIIGLQAAARSGNMQKVRHLRARAKKHLGSHDHNLLEGTIRRLHPGEENG